MKEVSLTEFTKALYAEQENIVRRFDGEAFPFSANWNYENSQRQFGRDEGYLEEGSGMLRVKYFLAEN